MNKTTSEQPKQHSSRRGSRHFGGGWRPSQAPAAAGQGAPDAVLAPREAVWQVVAAIPPGFVAAYGQVAALAGLPRRARWVGRVLAELPVGTRLPWHRVVTASGLLAERPGAAEQRRRLLAEGVLLRGRRVSKDHFWRNDPL